MAKSKKPRRKYSPIRVSRSHIDSIMHEVWFAGGACLKDVACGGVYDAKHSRYILAKPRNWTVMVLAFCSDGQRDYVDTKTVEIEGFKSKEEIEAAVPKMYHDIGNEQNPNHYIGWGWFLVPSHSVDLEASRDDIIKRFRIWGAFNRELCAIAEALRAEQYADDKQPSQEA